METLALVGKEHDEHRQGEALKPFSNDPHTYKKSFYIESYGCAMNFADSEVVASILNKEGYGATKNVDDADLIFLNTCFWKNIFYKLFEIYFIELYLINEISHHWIAL